MRYILFSQRTHTVRKASMLKVECRFISTITDIFTSSGKKEYTINYAF